MYPDIADGAGMLLNFKRIGQPIEGVYLLRVGDGLIVKNAQQMVDGNLRVFSSNPDGKYRDMVITPDDVADGRAAIIAKVVWADRLF
jgi:phage repressor protein C with HTH and peptisase S24 domain